TGQEAGAYPIGLGAEPQIDAGRLDLGRREFFTGGDLTARIDQAFQHMAGQDAGRETALAGFAFRAGVAMFGHDVLISRPVLQISPGTLEYPQSPRPGRSA